MAITIKQDVPDYAPVYNKLEVSCLSTNVLNTDFKYIFEIVTTIYGTFTYYVTPEPVLAHGTQEYGRLLQGFIKEVIAQSVSTSSFTQGTDAMILEYHIEYGEQYDVAGTITDFKDLTTGTTKYTWDAAFNSNEWIDQITDATPFNGWLMNTVNGTATEFLTSYKTPTVDITDLGWTYLLTDTVNHIDYLEVKTYDSAGVLIQTVNSNNVSSGSVNGKVKSVATSPQSLNNIAPALALGSQPIITSSVATYTVQIFEATPTAVSELLTFTIGECTRYGKYRLHFLNKLGGFDSYNFTARSQETASTKKRSYTRAETVIASGGITYSHEGVGSMDYYSRNTEKIKLRSDFLTDTENVWLRELVDSTNVLMEKENTLGVVQFYPVKVVTNNWTRKEILLDKTFTLEIDIEMSLQNTTQRR